MLTNLDISGRRLLSFISNQDITKLRETTGSASIFAHKTSQSHLYATSVPIIVRTYCHGKNILKLNKEIRIRVKILFVRMKKL